jgi:hypothetical protein
MTTIPAEPMPEALADFDHLVAAVRKASYQNRGLLKRNLPRHLEALRGAVATTPELEARFAAVQARTTELIGFLDNSGFMANAGNKKFVQAQNAAMSALGELRPLLLAA